MLIEGRVVLISNIETLDVLEIGIGNDTYRHISRESQNLSASTEIAEVKTYVLCL